MGRNDISDKGGGSSRPSPPCSASRARSCAMGLVFERRPDVLLRRAHEHPRGRTRIENRLRASASFNNETRRGIADVVRVHGSARTGPGSALNSRHRRAFVLHRGPRPSAGSSECRSWIGSDDVGGFFGRRPRTGCRRLRRLRQARAPLRGPAERSGRARSATPGPAGQGPPIATSSSSVSISALAVLHGPSTALLRQCSPSS